MFSRHLSISKALQCKILICSSIHTRAGIISSTRKLADSQEFSSIQSRMFHVPSIGHHHEDKNQNKINCELTSKTYQKQEMNTEKSSRSQNDSVYNYTECIRDLNLLQSNTQTIALAKYKRPEEILPLFAKQLELSGLEVKDLNNLNIVHVSGTKGKGSTCAFIESILRANGKKTGFYNSPHLIKVTERIRINGEPICDEKFTLYFRQVYDRLCRETTRSEVSMPSYFSFLTILAFHIFLGEKVEYAVIEVGMGGEYDPTNIVQKPLACGITTLDFDHTNILGNTIEDIAWSKAGILKSDVPVFVSDEQPEEALEVIRSRSKEKNSPLHLCSPLEGSSSAQLGIQGSVQLTNAALACQLSKYLLERKLPYVVDRNLETKWSQLPKPYIEALSSCSWPGRCQVMRFPRLSFYLDGAHTKKSMRNCLNWFLESSAKEDSRSRRILMLNIIGDRNKFEIMSQLSDYKGFEYIIFSSNRIDSVRDTSKSETFLSIQGSGSDKSMENVHKNASIWNTLCQKGTNDHSSGTMIMSNTRNSIDFILGKAKDNPEVEYHVLVTGSLHFVGAVSETLFMMSNTLNES